MSLTPSRWRGGRAFVALVLAFALLALPRPTPGPASLSLVRVESASAVDLDDGVVWVLAVGTDADAGTDVTQGNADAIQLVGVDVSARRAFALGIPRDFYVDIPGEGLDRVNQGLVEGGPELMARLVADLTGIEPQFVLMSKPTLFAEMVDAIGGLRVRADQGFTDEERDLVVRRGFNELTGDQAAAFAGARVPLERSDLDRSVNHQALLRAILRQVHDREGEGGFLETGAQAAFAGLETDLSPSEIYRFAHAVTEIDPRRVQACVLDGRPARTSAGGEVLIPARGEIRRLGAQIRGDAQLERRPQRIGC